MCMRKAIEFGSIVAFIGAILIFVGVAWLIAQNWHQIPWVLKIIILVVATSSAVIAGVALREREYDFTGKSVLFLSSLLYTLSVFLIAQIFSTSTSLQGIAWLLLLSWIGVIVIGYFFDSSASLVVAMSEFIIWLIVQLSSFFEHAKSLPTMYSFTLLAGSVLFYGLAIWHRRYEHEFASVYQWWTMLYLLSIAYLLSTQKYLMLFGIAGVWDSGKSTAGSYIFLAIAIIVALIIFISSIIATERKKVADNEVYGFSLTVLLLALIIWVAGIIPEPRSSLFSLDISAGHSWIWILSNIIFLCVILAVIGYGSMTKNTKIINLGIFFFTVDIITRYAGFIIDLGGYTSLSILFITGGVLLIGGGWLIEKWRRKLIRAAR